MLALPLTATVCLHYLRCENASTWAQKDMIHLIYVSSNMAILAVSVVHLLPLHTKLQELHRGKSEKPSAWGSHPGDASGVPGTGTVWTRATGAAVLRDSTGSKSLDRGHCGHLGRKPFRLSGERTGGSGGQTFFLRLPPSVGKPSKSIAFVVVLNNEIVLELFWYCIVLKCMHILEERWLHDNWQEIQE